MLKRVVNVFNEKSISKKIEMLLIHARICILATHQAIHCNVIHSEETIKASLQGLQGCW